MTARLDDADRRTGAEVLARSDLGGPGISRRRCGRGFRYFSPVSAPVKDVATLARIKALVIPPAWQEVWICPDPDGHIQATGTDAAGRRQYLYHQRWREEQDQRKFDRMLEFGRALPGIRRMVRARLGGKGLRRDRVLAAAVRLIDLGFFRAGERSTPPSTARSGWRQSAGSMSRAGAAS
jgi:DNA topoisomerase I